GDSLSFSIAAASILAKVTRDRIMSKYDQKFPNYGFAQHKGYATRAHLDAIEEYGFCEIHRRSFHPKRFSGQLDLFEDGEHAN
ncbi:ribonuclease HII, partial [bacterium]|nr:ribonuclease HII [bacterium]